MFGQSKTKTNMIIVPRKTRFVKKRKDLNIYNVALVEIVADWSRASHRLQTSSVQFG